MIAAKHAKALYSAGMFSYVLQCAVLADDGHHSDTTVSFPTVLLDCFQIHIYMLTRMYVSTHVYIYRYACTCEYRSLGGLQFNHAQVVAR